MPRRSPDRSDRDPPFTPFPGHKRGVALGYAPTATGSFALRLRLGLLLTWLKVSCYNEPGDTNGELYLYEGP